MVKVIKKFPSDCNLIRESLSADYDGEAAPLKPHVIKQHLTACRGCREYQIGLHRFAGLWKQEQPTFEDQTGDLWNKCLSRINAHEEQHKSQSESVRIQAQSRNNSVLDGWKRFAVAASIVLCVAIGSSLTLMAPSQAEQLVVETVRDFETFQVRGELLDISTNSIDEVVHWASAKVDFELPLLTDPPDGFTISGARLCSFFSRRQAFVHYEKESAGLSLYIMQARDIKMPDSGQFKTGKTESGLTTVAWRRDNLAYVIVSELSEAETLAFASTKS